MEGWLAVTVSGLVTVSLLKPGGALLTASESLCRLRGRVALADISFTGGGNIVVAATDGSSSSPVQFYKVRTRRTPDYRDANLSPFGRNPCFESKIGHLCERSDEFLKWVMSLYPCDYHGDL